MRPLWLLVVVHAALVSSLLSLALACSDSKSDSTTLEAYFDELASISRANQERTARAAAAVPGPDVTFEASRDASARFWEQMGVLANDTIDEVASLDPPDEVRSEHEAFVRALQELPGFFEEFAERIAGAASEEELTELTLSDFGEDTDQRVDDACATLQAVADANDVGVDLKC